MPSSGQSNGTKAPSSSSNRPQLLLGADTILLSLKNIRCYLDYDKVSYAALGATDKAIAAQFIEARKGDKHDLSELILSS